MFFLSQNYEPGYSARSNKSPIIEAAVTIRYFYYLFSNIFLLIKKWYTAIRTLRKEKLEEAKSALFSNTHSRHT